MSSLTQFLQNLSSDNHKKGIQFEEFAKWFFLNDPVWTTRVTKVWKWEEYPKRWGPDRGVDLVCELVNGKHWAVQAKCYDLKYSIKKSDLDSFLSETSRSEIEGRILIGTTDLLGHGARDVIEAQEKPVTLVLRDTLDRADVVFPTSIKNLSQTKPKPKPKPRRHQLEAIEGVVKGLMDKDRGQLLMCCGTGKTFTSLWIKERLKANSTLILVPSLGLLAQTLKEWTFARNKNFDVLCVCSDETVGKYEDPNMRHSSDLGFPVTTDSNEIRDFLNKKGKKVIFSTYQSSPKIVEVQKSKLGIEFDLVFADEAHRCAGKLSEKYGSVLDSSKIRAVKRVFMTATPRTYKATFKKSAEARGVNIASMDDESVFGSVLYELKFSQAIERGLLTDYRVVIVGVDDPMIHDWIQNRELLRTETGIETDAEKLAAHIGLIKTIKKYGLRRVISFHGRVINAKNFVQDHKAVHKWVPQKERPDGELIADYVSGKMSTGLRNLKIGNLKNIKNKERALLANSRCLSEGVDVPALDGVVFIDPKKSQIDIIQSVGRAIRKSDDKKLGTILIPVFIGNTEDPQISLEQSTYKPIWEVLNALKSHDDILSDELDNLRTSLGRTKQLKIDHFSKIHFELPKTISNEFSETFKLFLVESTTNSWMFWYGLLKDYVELNKTSLIPRKYITNNGYKLGSWLTTQRSRRNRLNRNQERMLELFPDWTWDVNESRWYEAYGILKNILMDNEHTKINQEYKTQDGFHLGVWVSAQRTKKDKLSTIKIYKLESLPGWTWHSRDTKWEKGLAYLKEYLEDNGDCLVPANYKTKDGYRLGQWVSENRIKKISMERNRIFLLEKLNGWSWNPREDRWNEGYKNLINYINEFKNSNVPTKYRTSKGYRLGSWVSKQRSRKEILPIEKKELLETINDWAWDAIDENWNKKIKLLEIFEKENKTTNVPHSFITSDGTKLGQWVNWLRSSKEKISPEKIHRLEAFESWSWDPSFDKWNQGFNEYNKFINENGHNIIKAKYTTEDGYNLGSWITRQRSTKDSMPKDRKILLESLPFWSWDVLTDQWEKGFDELKKYVKENGHSNVPFKYKTYDGYALGNWVSNQRSKIDKISKNRKELLESILDWSWKTIKIQEWENNYKKVKLYSSINGHTNLLELKNKEGKYLNDWLKRQRYRKKYLPKEWIELLELLPDWSWDPSFDKWNQSFAYLKEYSLNNGDCLVNQKFINEYDFKLGSWVSNQRSRKDLLTEKQKELLESLPGWFWEIKKSK